MKSPSTIPLAYEQNENAGRNRWRQRLKSAGRWIYRWRLRLSICFLAIELLLIHPVWFSNLIVDDDRTFSARRYISFGFGTYRMASFEKAVPYRFAHWVDPIPDLTAEAGQSWANRKETLLWCGLLNRRNPVAACRFDSVWRFDTTSAVLNLIDKTAPTLPRADRTVLAKELLRSHFKFEQQQSNPQPAWKILPLLQSDGVLRIQSYQREKTPRGQ